jgi:hypothetical protein
VLITIKKLNFKLKLPLSCRKEEFVWVMTLNIEGLIIIRADVDNNKLLNLKLKLTQIVVT